jgi:hypothetical protein
MSLTSRAKSATLTPDLTLKIYALVLKRRNRRQFGDAFDRLMQNAIPSMQHANMQPTRPVPEAA